MKVPDFPHLNALRPSPDGEMPQAVPFRPMESPPLAGAPLHRRSLLIGIAAGMLAAGAAAILLTDAWRHEDPRQFIAQTEPVPARPVPERAWPGARLNTGAAATWPGSGAVAPELLALAMPPLDLAEVGPTLSPEWQLVLAPPPVAPLMPSTLPPLASAPATVAPAGVPTASSSAAGHPNISMRVYRVAGTGPTLQEQLAACDAKSFFSRHSCRVQVCEPHLGKAAECPVPRQEVLP